MIEIKQINTKNAPAAIGPYSQAVIVNNMLYTSGQIPVNPKTGEITGKTIEEQAEQVIQNIQAILDEVGITFENIVKTTCFLNDMKDFEEFNRIYEKYFVSKPARSCVSAKELPKKVLCEVEVIALIKE